MENKYFGVLTVSDSCYTKKAEDLSGAFLMELISQYFNPKQIKYDIVPDEREQIEEALMYFSDKLELDIIFTTGGTGFSPRDVTPEATKNVINKEAPQLALLMTLASLEKTKFAALSRAICGIRNKTLIINFPGSKKAVTECFQSIQEILPHAIQLINNDLTNVKISHNKLQQNTSLEISHTINNDQQPINPYHDQFHSHVDHVCPHKIKEHEHDRNSVFPMIDVDKALDLIFMNIRKIGRVKIQYTSPISLPPFDASIKDGYAIKTAGGSGHKKVIWSIAAGDPIFTGEIHNNECCKINTGSPIPHSADAIIQIEDTRLHKEKNGVEEEIEVLIEPHIGLDIRKMGSDLSVGDRLFKGTPPFGVGEKSILASVGIEFPPEPKISIALISTGDELTAPGKRLCDGQIYDSNTTMLRLLLEQFGFNVKMLKIVKDNYTALKETVSDCNENCDIIISTGGVSMGDKDFVKPVLIELGYSLIFGRVNMKPGKPTTFGYNELTNKSFFGLPGNPVSAYVTFHLFVLPAIRHFLGWTKCKLPEILVELMNDRVMLDPRPEYARATIISKNGKLFASITGDQISSRLKSIIGADVLLHLPGKTDKQPFLRKGTMLLASILKHDFISEYQ